MRDFNKQYFSKNDVEAGLHIKFIEFLLNNFESQEYRVDMHVYHEDCGAICVEWIRTLWKYQDEMGKFAFVGEGQYVMQEVIMPDNSSEFAFNDDEAKELLANWKRSHKTKEEL